MQTKWETANASMMENRWIKAIHLICFREHPSFEIVCGKLLLDLFATLKKAQVVLVGLKAFLCPMMSIMFFVVERIL